jgi:sulfoquinovosidase
MAQFEFVQADSDGGFELRFRGKKVLSHDARHPLFKAGHGRGRYEMHRGNFKITEELEKLEALDEYAVLSRGDSSLALRFSRGADLAVDATFAIEDGRLVVRFAAAAGEPNRFLISLPATVSEHVYGCGEQFSYLDLRGHDFPL